MKLKFILFIFMFLNASFALVADAKLTDPSAFNSDSDSFFDDLEEQAVKVNSFATVEHKPPHVLMVWMRIIGSPIVNAYFSTSQKVQESWHWFTNQLNKKDKVKHEVCKSR